MYFMIRIERMDTKKQVVFRIDIFFFQDTKNLTYVFVFTRIEFLCFWIRISKKNVRRTRHKEWPKKRSKATPYSAGKRRIFGFFSFFATLIAVRNTVFSFVSVFRTRTNTKIVPKTRTRSAYESTAYESH